MQGRRNPSPRLNRSFEYADNDEILKISFVITFAGLVQGAQALAFVSALTPAGRRVLLFFVALNRGLKVGYRGTRATQGALADAVARATNAGCSVSTLKRGMNDLISSGLIVATWWNLYNRRGELVKYQRAPGEWETSKIRIYSLTPLALSLWSKQRKPKNAQSPTQVKKSCHHNRLSQPSVDKPLIQVPVTCPDLPASPHVELSPSDNKTTPLPGSQSSPATVGHELSARGKTALGAVRDFKTGCSVDPPPHLQKGFTATHKNMRLLLLANIYRFLNGFPTRQADCLFSVAVEETRPGASARALPFCIDWGRVLSSWSSLSRSERWRMWRRDILPGLRSAAFASPPDIEQAEADAAKMQGVAWYLQRKLERSRAARAARAGTEEGRLFGELPGDIEISKKEKAERLARYIEELRGTDDPVQKKLLQSAIQALMRSV